MPEKAQSLLAIAHGIYSLNFCFKFDPLSEKGNKILKKKFEQNILFDAYTILKFFLKRYTWEPREPASSIELDSSIKQI